MGKQNQRLAAVAVFGVVLVFSALLFAERVHAASVSGCPKGAANCSRDDSLLSSTMIDAPPRCPNNKRLVGSRCRKVF